MTGETGKSYRQLFYGGEAGRGGEDRPERLFATWNAHFRRFLPADREAEILDAGSGRGGFLAYLRALGYRRAGGLDINPAAVRRGREAGLGNLHCGDLRDWLAGNPDRYRTVIVRDVLEHFFKDEIVEVLGLIQRSLKTGGRLIAQTVNAQSPFALSARYGDFTHEIAFTAASLSALLERMGFRSVSCFPARPVAAHSPRAAIRRLLWMQIELAFRAGQAIETGNWRGIFTRNLIAVADR